MRRPQRRLRAAGLLPVILVLGACASNTPASTAISPPAGAVQSAAPSPPIAAATAPPESPPPPPTTVADPPVAGSAARAEVDRLQAAVQADPLDADAQRELGQALLQLIRETLDPSLYEPAEHALRESDRLQPDDGRTLTSLGALQLGRHEFADALRTGRRAVRLSPGLLAAHGVTVDALVELGRYEEAERAAARMFAVGEDLGSLARLSYLRELHGDLKAARTLMARAAGEPGAPPENRAFALSVLGTLERWTGDPAAARAAYQQALQLVPGHPPSQAGLARLAIGAGDLEQAEARLQQAAGVVPLPEYVIALGEVQAARGDQAAARQSFELAGAEIELFRANGVVVDLDLALFEADHGDPVRALDLARAAYAATPTTRAADAVGWALHRAGRDEEAGRWTAKALRLGTRDPLLRFHAGAIEAALGDAKAARADLESALSTDPGFSATGAAEARELLASLGR
jgi:tetratricopeptide (TPR) repeat protein